MAATGVTDTVLSGLFCRSQWLETGMTFRTLRERKLLSQEKLAEMSGLSLRTIQRAEAGHRVSYASLRALAVVFEMDVDLLERELYAVNQSTDDFVEIPRWVRLFRGASRGAWMGAKPLSRRQGHVEEAICIGGGVVFLTTSFFVPPTPVATVLRVAAAFMLVCGYLSSVRTRIFDTYRLWPSAEISWSGWRPARTMRTTIGFYAFTLLVVALFFAVVLRLTR
jgi:transcriptional regulator with XRE-family HTH domain